MQRGHVVWTSDDTERPRGAQEDRHYQVLREMLQRKDYELQCERARVHALRVALDVSEVLVQRAAADWQSLLLHATQQATQQAKQQQQRDSTSGVSSGCLCESDVATASGQDESGKLGAEYDAAALYGNAQLAPHVLGPAEAMRGSVTGAAPRSPHIDTPVADAIAPIDNALPQSSTLSPTLSPRTSSPSLFAGSTLVAVVVLTALPVAILVGVFFLRGRRH